MDSSYTIDHLDPRELNGPGGPDADKPIGLAYLAIADHSGVEVKRVLLGEHLSRDQLRDRASSAALNQLRLRLGSVDTT